jgi:Peptidase M76 family
MIISLMHELVHALDNCQYRNDEAPLKFDCNCDVIACSEIRAASSSGQCDFGAWRRRYPNRETCVKTSATKSTLGTNSRCFPSFVDAQFDKCYIGEELIGSEIPDFPFKRWTWKRDFWRFPDSIGPHRG